MPSETEELRFEFYTFNLFKCKMKWSHRASSYRVGQYNCVEKDLYSLMPSFQGTAGIAF